nr:immunoglobulin light chain junction region [Macaca mulatta]
DYYCLIWYNNVSVF